MRYFSDSVQGITDGELTFENVDVQIDEETYLKGIGTGEVLFTCNGKACHYTATVYYDWFDAGLLAYLNEVLEELGLEKRLIVFGGSGTNTIVYRDPEFCRRFKDTFPVEPLFLTCGIPGTQS